MFEPPLDDLVILNTNHSLSSLVNGFYLICKANTGYLDYNEVNWYNPNNTLIPRYDGKLDLNELLLYPDLIPEG